MTNKLTNTYNLNQQLAAGTISFKRYHEALLAINESED